MSTVELYRMRADEPEQVRLWRLDELRAAGYADDAAKKLARRHAVRRPRLPRSRGACPEAARSGSSRSPGRS